MKFEKFNEYKGDRPKRRSGNFEPPVLDDLKINSEVELIYVDQNNKPNQLWVECKSIIEEDIRGDIVEVNGKYLEYSERWEVFFKKENIFMVFPLKGMENLINLIKGRKQK